jgi:hypothetical protein
LDRRLGGTQRLEEKSSASAGDQPPVMQSTVKTLSLTGQIYLHMRLCKNVIMLSINNMISGYQGSNYEDEGLLG